MLAKSSIPACWTGMTGCILYTFFWYHHLLVILHSFSLWCPTFWLYIPHVTFLANLYLAPIITSFQWFLHNYCKWQKFQGWKVSWFAGFIRYVGKVSRSFHHHLLTVISILGNGREYITDTCTSVCRLTRSRMAMQLGYWKEEKSYSWSESEMKQITDHFLVNFFCKLLPNLLAERFFVTTVEYFSCMVSFQRSKSLTGKTFTVY